MTSAQKIYEQFSGIARDPLEFEIACDKLGWTENETNDGWVISFRDGSAIRGEGDRFEVMS